MYFRDLSEKLISLLLSLLITYAFIYALDSFSLKNPYKYHSTKSLHVIYFVEVEEDFAQEIIDDEHHHPPKENSPVQDAKKINKTDDGTLRQTQDITESGNVHSEQGHATTGNDETKITHYPGVRDLIRSIPAPDIQFTNRLPWERVHPLRDIPPERFKMKKAVTVEDIVRDFSRLLGFWPPGYSDSPCPRIRKELESLSATPSADPGLVKDLLLINARYCD